VYRAGPGCTHKSQNGPDALNSNLPCFRLYSKRFRHDYGFLFGIQVALVPVVNCV
jgi:hypothetical protein